MKIPAAGDGDGRMGWGKGFWPPSYLCLLSGLSEPGLGLGVFFFSSPSLSCSFPFQYNLSSSSSSSCFLIVFLSIAFLLNLRYPLCVLLVIFS